MSSRRLEKKEEHNELQILAFCTLFQIVQAFQNNYNKKNN